MFVYIQFNVEATCMNRKHHFPCKKHSLATIYIYLYTASQRKTMYLTLNLDKCREAIQIFVIKNSFPFKDHIYIYIYIYICFIIQSVIRACEHFLQLNYEFLVNTQLNKLLDYLCVCNNRTTLLQEMTILHIPLCRFDRVWLPIGTPTAGTEFNEWRKLQ